TELNAEQKEYLHLVKSSADALLAIVNDILDFSKIESGKMDIDEVEFNLPNLLSQATRSIALRAHQKGLELLLDIDEDIPEMLIGDPGRIRQIIVNLVGNAIKFTEHGEIVVKAVMSKFHQPAGKVALHLSVRDTGIGIPKEKFNSVFESFSQADTSTTRKYGGTGLGLTITTRLVELMGGCIWLESEVGQGSTFFTEILLRRADNSLQPQYQSGRLKEMRVLVVDDNATNRRLAVELLQRWGMKPSAVSDGLQAIAELERARQAGGGYQLLLLDVRMPGMNGFDVAERLRAQPDLVDANIMMITSDGQRGDAARCRELGVSAYLLKPYSQSDLFDAIMNTFGWSDKDDAPLVTRHSLQENKHKLHVLLAEDNRVNQTLATRLLQKFGHTVDVAD
ncbi:MAG: ATP-binding protein, partial [Actinomycetota bacterium]|nr:ATP-binding protein [Actinomycetota bacterium]